MADHGHVHGAGCNHGHEDGHEHGNGGMRIKNADNLDIPAEADIDLDAMHPEVQIPLQQYPLTEDELRSDYVMLTEDGGIKKKIITESKEPELGSPPKNSKVICHYTGTLPDNNDEKFDSSRDRDDPFEFKIGQGQVIKGWDVGIASMKKGERCILRCAHPYAYGMNGSPPKIPGGATLDFDVELLDWDDWMSCDGAEGQISKKIVIASDEYDEVANDGQCNITYRIYYTDNGIDQILCERKKFDMTVGDDDRFCEAFHTAIKSMKSGEKALFKILDKSLLNVSDIWMDSNELKENEFNNNKVTAPEGKRTFFEINIHQYTKGKESYNASNEEKIGEATKYKAKGNALFKQQRFLGAIAKYKKALDWVDCDFSDEALAAKKTELVVSANNNLSLIYIKMKDWSAAIEHSSKVLENDANNMKGLMRRGQARLKEGYLDLSKKDLKKALSLDKGNTYVQKMLKIVSIKHKEYVGKQQKLYAGMFGGKKKGKKKKKKNSEKASKDVTTKNTESESKDKEKETEHKDVTTKNTESVSKDKEKESENKTQNNKDTDHTSMEIDTDSAVQV